MFVTFLASLCLGIALAATAGLRAFVPLLAAGVAGRLEWIVLAEPVRWLGDTPALVALAVAVVLEVAADKVPALNHALDVVAVPMRTAAGVLAFVAVAAQGSPAWATALLSIVAGGAALSVHATRTGVRLAATAATAGTGSPFLSLAEDALCVVLAVLSVLAWVVAAAVALAALAFMVVVARRLLRRRRPPAQARPEGPAS